MAESAIAKAYVQIIPSAQGIKGKLTEALGGEAASAGTSSGKTLGNKLAEGLSGASAVVGKAFTAVVKTGAAALAGATAGIAAISKQALDAYGDYEQLVGGVETLFKDSADIVEKYAANAYKSAGLSANDYMESVTGFSASLLQSLGNDTGAAAEYANTAMVDMSDNANKMGTNMGDIQNAYQGFAKQNYTMLDNLKLGYGGTKEEMERLISDANKVKTANGEMADLSIESFADIVEAIHIIQSEMDITGTTAEEASTTIQGSVGSMKASWQNLLVGVADDSQDFDGLMGEFVESVETAASNILPRVQTILGGLGSLVSGLAPVIAEVLPTLVTTVLPDLLNAGVSMVTAFVDAMVTAIPEIAPQLASAAVTIMGTLADAVTANAPILLQAAMDVARTVMTDVLGMSQENADGVIGVLEDVLGACQTVFDALTGAVDTVISAVEDAGINWGAIWDGIGAAVSWAGELVSAAIAAIGDMLGWLVDESTTDGTLLNAVWDGIGAAVSGAGDVITGAVEALGGFAEWLFSGSAGAEAFQAAIVGLASALAVYKGVMLAQKAVTIAVTGVQAALNVVMNANPIGILVTAIGALVGALLYLWNTNDGFREAVTSAWEAIKSAFSSAIDAICGFFSDLGTAAGEIWDGIKETVGGVIDAISGFFTGLAETASSVWETIKNAVQVAVMFIGEVISAAVNIITLPFQFIWENCKDIILGAWDAITGAVSAALDTIGGILSGAWDTISGAVSTAWDGISSVIGSAWDGISSTVGGALDTVGGAISSGWESVKSWTSSAWDTVSSTVSSAAGNIKEKVSGKWAEIQANNKACWDAVKSVTSTVWGNIKSTVGDKVGGIKSVISDKLTAAKNVVTSVFSAIKNAISDKINSAKETVSSVIEKIKGFFNFSWSLPKLKMPHLSITGSFSISPPSVPHFGIEWYAKAMDTPMVLSAPTIFGASGGKLLAGGEAGEEIVSGADTLMGMIRGAVGGELSGGMTSLEEKLDRLISLLSQLAGVNITVNGADYRSKMELAEAIIDLITREKERRAAAFG